jgi:hypothetical protein
LFSIQLFIEKIFFYLFTFIESLELGIIGGDKFGDVLVVVIVLETGHRNKVLGILERDSVELFNGVDNSELIF